MDEENSKNMSRYLNLIAEKNQVIILNITIAIINFSFFWIYPLLWVLSASFKTDFEIWGGLGLIPDRLVWENFERAWFGANIPNGQAGWRDKKIWIFQFHFFLFLDVVALQPITFWHLC